MHDILVSILVVVYNHESYIDDCIQSILNQTYRNLEIIIADDCSTDNSFQKAMSWKEKLQQSFENVYFIQTPHNMGIVGNLNNALQYVTGKYIKWIGSDDMLLPYAIERMVAFLNTNPRYAMLYSNYLTCTEEEHYSEVINSEREVCKAIAGFEQEQYAQALYENDFIVVPTTLVRCDVVRKLNFFDQNIGVEDWGSWIEIALHYEIGYLDETTAIYRTVKNSMSRFTPDEKGRERLKFMLTNEFKILDKFKNEPKIEPKAGIKYCCEQGISIAVDIGAEDLIQYIKGYAKENEVRLSIEMKLKYIFYRMHILKRLQSIKRKLGMETTTIFD